LLVAFYDLCDQDLPPWPQPGAPLGSYPLRIAKRLTNGPDIGAQPIATGHGAGSQLRRATGGY
jgi:hypothetical protein